MWTPALLATSPMVNPFMWGSLTPLPRYRVKGLRSRAAADRRYRTGTVEASIEVCQYGAMMKPRVLFLCTGNSARSHDG